MDKVKDWKKDIEVLTNNHPIRASLILYVIVLGGMYLGRIISFLLWEAPISKDTLYYDFLISISITFIFIVVKKVAK